MEDDDKMRLVEQVLEAFGSRRKRRHLVAVPMLERPEQWYETPALEAPEPEEEQL